MKQKHWKVSVFDKTSETIKDDTFYTTDTEAYLIFELIDDGFTPDEATITVYNLNGKATINENVEVVDGMVRYEIPEEAIGHTGGWRTQVIYTKDNEDYTTGIIKFDVSGHLLDHNKPKLVAISNWNRFIKHAGALIDDWEQLEEIRQTNEQQRELAEKKRHNVFETNETNRVTAESGRVSAEQARVNAENVRAEFYEGFDGRLDDLEADKVAINNLVTNGDFSQGTTGWEFGRLDSSMVVSDGVSKVGARYVSYSPYYSIVIDKDKKYFISSQIKNVDLASALNTSYALTNGNSPINESQRMDSYFDEIDTEKFSRVSRVVTANDNYTSVSLMKFTSNSSVSQYAYFDDLIFVNLTDIFGAGNEPTKSEMDELIKITGYFDEITLTQKQMLTWQLKLMRQNRNALIALGVR